MAEATTAALAGPPRRWPSREKAILMKKLPAPAFSRMEPNITNRKISDAETPSATPKTPSFCIQ